jgi:diketogulonate reductase-like aldo/keto reductase
MVRRCSFQLLLSMLVALLAESTEVGAEYYARSLQPPTPEDPLSTHTKKPAPAGVTNVMGSEAQVGSIISFHDGVVFAKLVNNNRIPLVGYGVGNLQHELIKGMVASALQDNKKTMLIDTAHASRNEHLVAEGIVRGIEKKSRDRKTEVHVVTKVWYTHLGYERTKISVQESLQALQPAIDHDKVDLKLHVLLHWPKCHDDIPWMNCEQEEADLPAHVRAAGPDPNQDKENAWKESWRALEDMYLSDEYPIESIGVSNFHLPEIEVMDNFARIHPHVLQVNLWSLLYDAHLVEYCHRHRIHVQVYNAMHGTMNRAESAPRAYHHIQKVAYDLSKQIGVELTPAQVILAWLIQHGISVIPRTSNPIRLEENSLESLMNIPAFTDHQVETVAHAVEAYMSGDDLEQDIHVSVTFHAVSKDIMLYWMGHGGDETTEMRITVIRKGEEFQETTYPGHKFRTYDPYNKDVWIDHEITANFGDHSHIHVEL